MTTITLAFEHAPASGQATKELPVRVNMDEAFFKNTREFLPWDISDGTATLPYLAFEKFLDLVGVPRVLEHVLVSESVLTTSFELPFIAQVLGRLIDLGLFEGWPKDEWF